MEIQKYTGPTIQMDEQPPKKPLPLFELLISLFSLYMAALLFWFPDLLANGGPAYDKVENMAGAQKWAFIFFAAGIIKVIGIMMNKKWVRIVGLLMSVVIYSILTIAFSFSFPNFTVGIFGLLTFFSLVQIFYTDYFELT